MNEQDARDAAPGVVDVDVEEAEAASVPLEADDLLIQRFLEGLLDDEEELQVEFRMDEDEAFAARVHGYDRLFTSLDRGGFFAAPAGIAEAAVAAWKPESFDVAAATGADAAGPGLVGLFGGLRPAAAVFVVADVLLAGLIVGLMVTEGPVEIFKTWVLGLKDLLVFVVRWAPSGDQLAFILPTALIGSMALLVAVAAGLRRIRGATPVRY